MATLSTTPIWAFYSAQAGYLPITSTISTTDTYPNFGGEAAMTNNRGQIVQAYDTTGTVGGGEFIFLAGVASTVAGDLVTYDPYLNTTTRWTGTGNTGAPLAVAMAANNSATTMGWYQISGAAQVNVGTNVTAGSAVYYGTATGTIGSTVQGNKQVEGATALTTTTVASGFQAIVLINRPTVQSQNS